MRFLDAVLLNNADASAASATSTQAAEVNMMKLASVQVVATGTLVGTLKLQFSNDIPTISGIGATPINWTDIPSASVAVSGAGSFAIAPINIAYNWIRAVYTKTSSTGSPKVTVTAHCIGDSSS